VLKQKDIRARAGDLNWNGLANEVKRKQLG